MENRLSLEELKERYKDAKCFTSGVVFGVGDGYLGPVVRDAVIRRNEDRQNKEKVKVSKKKSDLRKLAAEVSKIRHQQALDSIFFLTNKSLKNFIAWKRQKDHQKLPSKRKEDLLN